MILRKGRQYQKKVKISNRPSNALQLKNILSNKKFKEVDIDSLKLSDDKSMNQILIDVDSSIVDLFSNYPALGNNYKCVTCISTGDDKKYLSKNPCKGYTVPFYKNPASKKFNASADAYLIDNYLEEASKVKDFMVRNKSLLSQEGIACSSMGLPFSAVYLPANAVTGVNPTIFPPTDDLYWLLSYLNSSLATYLIRGVLIRSNMVTSGYVSHLPLLPFTDIEKKQLSDISKRVIKEGSNIGQAIEDIDKIIYTKNILPGYIYTDIIEFSRNLGKRV